MKRIKAFIVWDHACQCLFVLGSIPNIVLWIRGRGTLLGAFLVGFNLGSALYWQLCLMERKRKKEWMERAFQALKIPGSLARELEGAKRLAQARLIDKNIDPDLN